MPGETVAAALAAADIVAVRRARSGAPRGPFCGMGVCFDCLVTVDGRPNQRACLTKVAENMEVRSEPPAYRPSSVTPAAAPEEIACDVLVVGAGPAGLSAARDLALAGADVVVADDRLHPGGQYFKPLAPSHTADSRLLDRQFREGAVLHQSALQAGVRILSETTVWAAFSPTEIAAVAAGRSILFRPKRLLLATGAYEQSLPVPGWTLPGVMTVGGLQTLARSYRVAPGNRIVIAGNGPLCLQTAVELLEGGANVVAVLESAPRPGISRLPALLSAAAADPFLFGKGASLAHRLRGLVHWRRRVTRLSGGDRVRAVEAADLAIEADIVALGYGFASSSELARSLGCTHRFVARGMGSMETVTDDEGRTSIAEAFAIGDGASFGGADVARAQGAVAAAAIARDLGLSANDARAARRTLKAARRFQSALWRLFEAAPLQPRVMANDAIVCRCEEVPSGLLRWTAEAGYNSPSALKHLTRAGMGRCQGRYCATTVARLCSPEVGEYGLYAPRPPAKPVPIGPLAIEHPEWNDPREVVPPDMGRSRGATLLPVERVDTLVIGGGITGCCLAYWLAQEGIETLVVERDGVGSQASSANAGSLHIQLQASEIGAGDPAEVSRAADVLPLGPAALELWREIERTTKQDFELDIGGGLMLAESESEIGILKSKVELEKSRAIEVELIGADELHRLEPCIGEGAIAAVWCPREGRINPLLATHFVAAAAGKRGARFRSGAGVTAISREGAGWRVVTGSGDVLCGNIVNAAGPWVAEIAKLAGFAVPVRGEPLQVIATEPAAPTLTRLVSHAARHLSLKQVRSGAFVIGGGWTACVDERRKLTSALRPSIAGNLWVASRAVPALGELHVVRAWGGINISLDHAPILGEVPGLPGFYNCVGSKGFTLAPVLARLTAEMIAGRSTSLAVEPYSIRRFG